MRVIPFYSMHLTVRSLMWRMQVTYIDWLEWKRWNGEETFQHAQEQCSSWYRNIQRIIGKMKGNWIKLSVVESFIFLEIQFKLLGRYHWYSSSKRLQQIILVYKEHVTKSHVFKTLEYNWAYVVALNLYKSFILVRALCDPHTAVW